MAPIDKDEFKNLSEEEKLAYIELHSYKDPRKEMERQSWLTTGWPRSWGQALAGLLGLPIERYRRHINHPFLISSFISLFLLVHILAERSGIELVVQNFGFIPSLFYRDFFLTFLTSFFLHGSWMHLLGNAYYFFAFGDDVEDELGFTPFIMLLLGGHVAGMILDGFLGGHGDIPVVGASAGISALMGYYMIRFPRRQITYMLFVFYWWAHIPAFLAFLWKFAWELLFATSPSAQYSHVAFWAHVGGGAFGILFAFSQPKRTVEKPEIID